jgi:hypothetical protein
MPYFDPDTVAEDAIRRLFNFKVRLDRQLSHEARTDFAILGKHQFAPLTSSIKLLVRIANGEYRRSEADTEFIDEAYAALQDVVETFCVPPFSPSRYAIPDSFYEIPVGQVVQRVDFWLRSDDLITQTQAAELLTGQPATQASLQRVKRLIEKGARGEEGGLRSWEDPGESHPLRKTRVSRSEVQALAELKHFAD